MSELSKFRDRLISRADRYRAGVSDRFKFWSDWRRSGLDVDPGMDAGFQRHFYPLVV